MSKSMPIGKYREREKPVGYPISNIEVDLLFLSTDYMDVTHEIMTPPFNPLNPLTAHFFLLKSLAF